MTFDVPDKIPLKRKKTTKIKPTSHKGLIKSKKELRKSACSDKRLKHGTEARSAIFKGMRKMKLDSVKDWVDKDLEHPRIEKIRKSNKFSHRKIVNGKKLPVWACSMKKQRKQMRC